MLVSVMIADDPTADVTEALAALVSRNTSRPGSSWRVGVGKNLQPKDLLEQQVALGAGSAAITQGKSLLEGLKLHRAAKDRIKPAILTVSKCWLMACARTHLQPSRY